MILQHAEGFLDDRYDLERPMLKTYGIREDWDVALEQRV